MEPPSRVPSVRTPQSPGGPARDRPTTPRISCVSMVSTGRAISESRPERAEKPHRGRFDSGTLVEVRRVAARVENERLDWSRHAGGDRLDLPQGPIFVVAALDHERRARDAGETALDVPGA